MAMASITVLGGGPLGCWLAARAVHAGHPVQLVTRDSARWRATGLVVDEPVADGRRRLTIRPGLLTVTDHPITPPASWLFIAQPMHLHDPKRIRGLLHATTAVVAACDGLGPEEQLARWIDQRQIFGLVPHLRLMRGDDGVVHLLGSPLVTLGHARNQAGERQRLIDLILSLDLPWTAPMCLRAERWRRLVFSAAICGGCAELPAESEGLQHLDAAQLRCRARYVRAVALADLAANWYPDHLAEDVVDDAVAFAASCATWEPPVVRQRRAGRSDEQAHLWQAVVERGRELGVPPMQLR